MFLFLFVVSLFSIRFYWPVLELLYFFALMITVLYVFIYYFSVQMCVQKL